MAIDVDRASARSPDDTGVIDLHGQMDRSAEPAVTAAFDSVLADGASHVVMNFADVDYINSTGIAVIVGILARARKEGLAVTARGLTDHYKYIFQITRLSDFMTITDDDTTTEE